MRNLISILFVVLTSAGMTNAQQLTLEHAAPAVCSSSSLVSVCPADGNSRFSAAEAAAPSAASNPLAESALSSDSKSSKSDQYPSRPRSTRDKFDLAVGFEYFHYRSSIFNSNLYGLHTSFTYFRYEWLGIEGNVGASFGTSNLLSESSRAVLYAAGPRIAWREKRFQPWLHALVGGLHIRPQTASNINGVAFQLGGGMDWRYKPLISFRAESDYVRSQVNSSGQNSFQLGGGVVFHF